MFEPVLLWKDVLEMHKWYKCVRLLVMYTYSIPTWVNKGNYTFYSSSAPKWSYIYIRLQVNFLMTTDNAISSAFHEKARGIKRLPISQQRKLQSTPKQCPETKHDCYYIHPFTTCLSERKKKKREGKEFYSVQCFYNSSISHHTLITRCEKRTAPVIYL